MVVKVLDKSIILIEVPPESLVGLSKQSLCDILMYTVSPSDLYEQVTVTH